MKRAGDHDGHSPPSKVSAVAEAKPQTNSSSRKFFCSNQALLQEAMRQVTQVKERKHIRKSVKPTFSTKSRPLLPRLPSQINVVLPTPSTIMSPISYFVVQPSQVLLPNVASQSLISQPLATSSQSNIVDQHNQPTTDPPKPFTCATTFAREAKQVALPNQAITLKVPEIHVDPPSSGDQSPANVDSEMADDASTNANDVESRIDRDSQATRSEHPKIIAEVETKSTCGDITELRTVAPIPSLLDISLGEPPNIDLSSNSSNFGAVTCELYNQDSQSSALGLGIDSNPESRAFKELASDPLVSALPTIASNAWLNGDYSNDKSNFDGGNNASKTFPTPIDVDSQLSLSNLVTENSVDLVAKFAILAEHVNDNNTNSV